MSRQSKFIPDLLVIVLEALFANKWHSNDVNRLLVFNLALLLSLSNWYLRVFSPMPPPHQLWTLKQEVAVIRRMGPKPFLEPEVLGPGAVDNQK